MFKLSKKNIVGTEKVGNKLHVTFDAADGKRTYEYGGNSLKAFRRGTDPNKLSGRLVRTEKKK